MLEELKKFTLFHLFLIIIATGIILEIIVGSNNLIRNSNVKKIIIDINKYNNAIKNFKRKYGQLPGDIRKTKILGLSETNTDGNENGLIEDSKGSIKKADGEITKFWLHLSNSEFLQEKFDGKDNSEAKVGTTFPKITNSVGITVFSFDKDNYLQIGVIGANDSNIEMTNQALSPGDAFFIDKKLDDGLPDSGDIRAVGGENFVNGINDVDKNCATKREYLIKSEKPACQLRILIMPQGVKDNH
jgi:hypothetical protein